jgi:signal transduction protein with GAF and PtsI domain
MATAPNLSALNVVYRPHPVAHQNASIHPLLELSLAQTNSQGAYLYRLDRAPDSLELVAWSGRAVSAMESFDVELRPQAAGWHRENLTAVLLDRDAWSDWRFDRFPEFLRNRFQAIASVPLLDHGAVVGVVNICRAAPSTYQQSETTFLRSLSLPLGALLSHAALRVKLESEVEALSRKLADRKLLERAKGLLQVSHQWTEEQAYLNLRRTSRQRRTAMRDIAQEVIGLAANGPLLDHRDGGR